MNSGHGVATRPVEFSEFLSEIGDSHYTYLPREPATDLYVKLETARDFRWAVEHADVTTKYSVVCQFRKSLA